MRERSKKEPWSIGYQSEGIHPFAKVNEIVAEVVTRSDHRLSAEEALASLRYLIPSVLVVEQSEETAIVLEFKDPPLFGRELWTT